MSVLSILENSSVELSVLAAFLEGLGVPFPGAVFLASSGARFPTLPAVLMLATVFATIYTASSVLQYLLGRFGRSLVYRWLSPAMRSRLDDAMYRYGQAAVFWTRPLAIGNYISIPAGMMRMHLGRFLLYTFLGIWPWAFGMVAIGAFAGAYAKAAADWLPWALCLLALPTCVKMLRQFRSRRRAEALPEEETPEFCD